MGKLKNDDQRKDRNSTCMDTCGNNCCGHICNATPGGSEGADVECGEDGEGDGFSGSMFRKRARICICSQKFHFIEPDGIKKLPVSSQDSKHHCPSAENGIDEVDGYTPPDSPSYLASNDGRMELTDIGTRIQTFKFWPKQGVVTGKELAKCGFYYLNDRDRVKCVYCNLILKDWESEDDPATEHKRFSQYCQFEQYMLPESLNTSAVGEPSLGICYDRPKFPEYAVEGNRMKTFTFWPASNSQSREDMAKAGFFFVGTPDRVACFFCGLRLHNFSQDDEPWFEHARHGEKCTFVLQCKGEDFVSQVKEAVAKGQMHLSPMVTVPQTLPSSTTKSPPITQKHRDKKDMNIEQYMNSPSVRSLLEIMLVSLELVTKALAMHLEKSEDCPDAATLMDYVYQIEDEKKKDEEKKEKSAEEADDGHEMMEFSQASVGMQQHGACGTLADETVSQHTFQARSPKPAGNRYSSPTPTGGLLASQPTTTFPSMNFELQDEPLPGLMMPPDETAIPEDFGEISENHRPKSLVNKEVLEHEKYEDDEEDIYGDDVAEMEIQAIRREEEEVSKLKSENEELQQERRCKICLDEIASILFLPCGHLVCCSACSPALRLCPICRKGIQGTVKTFRV